MRHREQRSSAVMTRHRAFGARHLWIVGLLLVAGLFSYNLYSLYQSLVKERVADLQFEVETAVFQVSNYHRLAQQGAMKETEAMKSALKMLRSLGDGEDDYFWVVGGDSNLLMHPKYPDREGSSLLELPAQGGDSLWQAIESALKSQSAGFIDYRWARGQRLELVEKSGYVQRFAPWGWIVGSGVYIDDIENRFWNEATSMMIVALILLAVLVIFWFGFEKALFFDPVEDSSFDRADEVR